LSFIAWSDINHSQLSSGGNYEPDLGESIRQQFAAAASNYAVSGVHSGGPNLDAMLERAALRGSERVLDVGCGAGHTALASQARPRGRRADMTQEMLDEAARLSAQRGLANIAFRYGVAEALPFPDGSFDIVTSRFCAHHYADPVRATHEASRVLRKGGRYLLVDSVALEDPVQDTYFNALEVLRDPSHVRNASVSAVARDVRARVSRRRTSRRKLRLEFEPWLARIGTPRLLAEGIRSLMDAAPREVRSARAVGGDGLRLPRSPSH
jgi:ubiquinone/menaquinone biosynthesis C-methylase UbiE